jgi:hypothetical protein
MGLDVYVGSLTRYYRGDWETVVQRYARERGLKFQVVRPSGANEDCVPDAEEIRATVLAWREMLSDELGEHLDEPLDWDETAESPYFTDKPAGDCYSSLLLWAAYSEHPELIRPETCIESWGENEAYQRSANAEFQTSYPSLLRGTEIWFPINLGFTFAAEDVAGNRVVFGSTIELCEELVRLNANTWNADAETVSRWRREGAEHLAPLEVGARFAFSVFFELANAASEHKLVMKLDY